MKTTPPSAPAPAARRSAKAARPRLPFAEVMAELEAAGSAQTRKTYARHGVTEPMFGVSFATLKALMKRIDVDHELAMALWDTGNFDARNLAVKVLDPLRMSAADLDRWAEGASQALGCGEYAASLPAEGQSGVAKAREWLASANPSHVRAGWSLAGALALRDEDSSDGWFLELLGQIERDIHTAPNAVRSAMNRTMISIGCRNPSLRSAALATAGRVGVVDVDHGDTACETPDAAASIEKAWAYALSKGASSPAAQERQRDWPRRRC
jgi:3-methyladenine DNA glycosylase AlkD